MAEYNNDAVQTSVLNLWDSNGNQLRVGGNNQGLSIAIWIPQVSPEGIRRYPVPNRISTMLTQKNVAALENMIFENLLPMYESGKDGKFAMFTNAARTTMLEMEVVNAVFKISIYKNCDPTTRQPQQKVSFIFDIVNTITGYTNITDSFDTVPVQADMAIFSECIRSYHRFSGGTIAGHGVRIANQYSNKEHMRYIRAIASAVKAELPAQTPSPQNGFSAEIPQYSPSVPNQQMEEVNDFKSLLS